MSPRGLAWCVRGLVALAGLLPFLVAISPHVAEITRPAFATVCHQRPERTLALFGAPMVVCSRCAGLYAGAALGAFVALPRALAERGAWCLGGALVLALADVVTQDLGLHAPFHPVRVATGFLLGASAAGWMSAKLGETAPRGA